MKQTLIGFLTTCIVFLYTPIFGQIRQYYHKDPLALIEEQSKQVFNQAYSILQRYPPSPKVLEERKMALFALDGLYHDRRTDSLVILNQQFASLMNRVIDSLKNPPHDNGVRIYKIYNHGFIIQTNSITIAIDLVRGSQFATLSNDHIQEFADLCDMMFISHKHSDHADSLVAEMFVKRGKNVVVPHDLWHGQSKYYHHLRDSTHFFNFSDKKQLDVTAFPGHQGEVPNNIYLISLPEGMTVMHSGDQSNNNDLSWIKKISQNYDVDILLAHCWMPNLKQAITGIQPKLIITGHENELGHSIDHREPYWLTFQKFEEISTPTVIMAWGENFYYQSPQQ